MEFVVKKIGKMNQALIAHRSLAERARGFVWHSSADGRIGSGATSL